MDRVWRFGGTNSTDHKLISRSLGAAGAGPSWADDAFEIPRDPSEALRRIRTPSSWRDEADTSGGVSSGLHQSQRSRPPLTSPWISLSLFPSGSNGIRSVLQLAGAGAFEPGRLYPGGDEDGLVLASHKQAGRPPACAACSHKQAVNAFNGCCRATLQIPNAL